MKYKDGLGYVYDVPDEDVEEFEMRRRPLLIASIVIKLIVFASLVWLFGGRA